VHRAALHAEIVELIALAQQQGSVFELRPIMRSPGARGGGVRGAIAGFSRASRRRLIDMFARLDTSGVRSVFLTLTFAGTPDPETAKAAYRRFAERIKRRYSDVCWVWRMEFQRRGSIHFHLLAFRLPYIPQRELQNIWTECTGEERSIVHVKLLHGKRAAMNYCSKYVSKLEDTNAGASLDNVTYPHDGQASRSGRLWGVCRRELLPFAKCFTAFVEGEGELGYCRWAAGAISRQRAIRHRVGCKLYSDDAPRFFRHLMALLEHMTVGDFEQWMHEHGEALKARA